jgi:hypothetical protein
VVEPDAPVLRRAAFVVLAVAVVAWAAVAPHIAAVSLWPTVAIISAAVMPATLGLIYLALPLWPRHWILPVGVALGIAAFVSWKLDSHLVSNFAKLGAYTCFGWAFLWLFEELSWVLIVALIIPFVDAVSVAAGPTKAIVNHHFEVYSAVAVAFLAPGGLAADLGPPDIAFYALFLAGAARWGLRTGWTWIAMTSMYSLTLVIANTANLNGLPALPFLSFGFLVANGDLLWRRFRPAR